MSFNIQKFYEELDQHYHLHDNSQTERFLMEMITRTKHLHDISPIPVSCPSCVEMPTVNMEYVTVCNEAACFYRGISSWSRSIELFDQALHELELFYLQNTGNYATILLNKAGTLRLMGRYDDAICTFKKAETFFLHEDECNHYALASINNNLSLVYQNNGRLLQAAECTQNALHHLSLTEATEEEQGTTYNNLSILLKKMGEDAQAAKAIDVSINILRELDNGMNAHYPAALNTKASLLFNQGSYTEALSLFQEALQKTESIFGRNVDYVNGCLNIAQTFEQLKDSRQAEDYRQKAALAEAMITK